MRGKTYRIGIEIAMIEAAGSVRVQIVRSTRSYVMSVLVMLTTSTDFTIPVTPALGKC
jgi:tRNA(Met) C34 N-acetyltransferase TmcA